MTHDMKQWNLPEDVSKASARALHQRQPARLNSQQSSKNRVETSAKPAVQHFHQEEDEAYLPDLAMIHHCR
ncbi:hypothetical protein Bca4012_055477 [Brassica carinata]